MEKQYLLDSLRGKLISADVKADDVLVLAVSGGPDSMALLDIVRQLAPKDKFRIVVVHINHGLRTSAVRDQRVVEEYCRKTEIECVVRLVKLAGAKQGIEEKARLARYRALRELKEAYSARWILTAHNSDDQVETIILNFLRGSGVRGMGGMRLMTEDVLRPLLDVPKSTLLKYLKKQKIKFVVDETNAQLDFARNRVRHQLIPVLEKYNPKLKEGLLQNSGIFQQADVLIRQLASHSFPLLSQQKGDRVSISISRMRELLPIIQMEVVRLAIEKLRGNIHGIKKIHIDTVFDLVANQKPKLLKRLPGKLLVEKAYDTITIVKEERQK